jgi:hypothetical protein
MKFDIFLLFDTDQMQLRKLNRASSVLMFVKLVFELKNFFSLITIAIIIHILSPVSSSKYNMRYREKRKRE